MIAARIALLPVLLLCLWSVDRTAMICDYGVIAIEPVRETSGTYFEGYRAVAHTRSGRGYEVYRAHQRLDVERWVEQTVGNRVAPGLNPAPHHREKRNEAEKDSPNNR